MQANGFDLWIRVYCDNASAGVLVPLVSGEFPFHNAIPTVILARRVAVHLIHASSMVDGWVFFVTLSSSLSRHPAQLSVTTNSRENLCRAESPIWQCLS